MRCDQFMGLPSSALDFLSKNKVLEDFCEHCGQFIPRELEEIDEFVGMFEDKYPLYRHQLKDGRFADEFVQSDLWSSGPCFFLGLDVHGGDTANQKFTWPQDTIDEA